MLLTPADDLLARTAELVDIGSVSFDEGAIAAALENELGRAPHLQVSRIGDNVVARTALGRPWRVALVGHLDTVPAEGNAEARRSPDTVAGRGAVDMKGALAVMLALARSETAPGCDVTYVFYAREEVAAEHSGLEELFAAAPELLGADAAIIGEPTDGAVEAGCQGTFRLRLVLRGRRAHTARPWMGRNAIHRLAPVLAEVNRSEPRRPVIDGLTFVEALQAVDVGGGVAGNVVPDEAVLVLNGRVAPDRTTAQAVAAIRARLEPHLEAGDDVELTDAAEGAPPSRSHPLLAALIERGQLAVRPKLGWTDVARFAARGVAAVNFGPGDPLLAHTAEERVTRRSLEAVHGALVDLLRRPPNRPDRAWSEVTGSVSRPAG